MKTLDQTPQTLTSSDPLATRRAFEIQARFARTMGHPIRLQILNELHQAEREVGVAELLKLLAIPKAALSQHLTKMVSVGLVRTRREGRFVYVRLAHPEIARACEIVRGVLVDQAREQESMLQSKIANPAGTEFGT